MIEEIIGLKKNYIRHLVTRKDLTSEDAEDLFQDAFVVCIERNIYDVPFFIACLKNKVRVFLRNRYAENVVDIDIAMLSSKKEHHINSDDVINLFHGRARDIAKLRIKGFSFKEISKELNQNESNTRQTFMNARKKIKQSDIERIKNG